MLPRASLTAPDYCQCAPLVYVCAHIALDFDCRPGDSGTENNRQCSVNGMQLPKAAVLAFLVSLVSAQLSDPIAGDHQVKSLNNKFLKRKATQDETRLLRCGSMTRLLASLCMRIRLTRACMQ